MAVLKDIHENVHSSFLGNWISSFVFSFLLSLFLHSFKWNVCIYIFSNKIFQIFILKVNKLFPPEIYSYQLLLTKKREQPLIKK